MSKTTEKKTKEKVLALYTRLTELAEKKARISEQLDPIDKEAKAIKMQLADFIPANTTAFGLYHQTVVRPSVRYTDAIKDITEKLVPKTKTAEVASILAEHTTMITSRDDFKPVES